MLFIVNALLEGGGWFTSPPCPFNAVEMGFFLPFRFLSSSLFASSVLPPISNLQHRGTSKPQAGTGTVHGGRAGSGIPRAGKLKAARAEERGDNLLSAALMGYLLKTFLPLRKYRWSTSPQRKREGRGGELRGKEGEGEGERWRVRREGGGEGWTSDVIWGDPYNGACGLRKTVGNRGRDKRV